MRPLRAFVVLLVSWAASVCAETGVTSPNPLQITNSFSPITRYTLVMPLKYLGMCAASGGVPVTSNIFAVANDEDNILRLYRREQPGYPLREFDFNSFLQ